MFVAIWLERSQKTVRKFGREFITVYIVYSLYRTDVLVGDIDQARAYCSRLETELELTKSEKGMCLL